MINEEGKQVKIIQEKWDTRYNKWVIKFIVNGSVEEVIDVSLIRGRELVASVAS